MFLYTFPDLCDMQSSGTAPMIELLHRQNWQSLGKGERPYRWLRSFVSPAPFVPFLSPLHEYKPWLYPVPTS